MNVAEMLGTPVADPADSPQPTASNCALPTPIEQPPLVERSRRSWLWTILVAAVALAVGVATGSYLSSPPAPDAPPNEVLPVLAPPPTVGSFAEMVTALHLSGIANAEDLEPLFAGSTLPPAPSGLWVNRAAAVSTKPQGSDFWVVTVAVDTLEMNDGAYEAAGLQYYDITVAMEGNRPLAVSAPARVPGPGTTVTPASIPSFDGAVPADQAAAAAGFLDAYLSGSGEVARFVSPTAPIPRFPAAPYASVEILSLGSDSLGRIRAEIEAATSRGGHQTLEYTLEMTFESGVWEVSNLVSPAHVRS